MSTYQTYHLQARTVAAAEKGQGWRTLLSSVDLDALFTVRGAMMGRVNAARTRLAKVNKRSRGARYTLPRHMYAATRIVDAKGRPVA